MASTSGSSNTSTSAAGGLRCVLWHAPGANLPGELLTSLSRRISHISVCTDAYAAMAEVCALEASRRAITSGSEPASTVLLIVHPAQLIDAAEVVTELRTYAPGALAWKYDASANPKLSAIVESDVTRWATHTSRTTGGGATAAAGVESFARTTHDRNPLSSVSAPHGGSSPLTSASEPRRTPASPPARVAQSATPASPAQGGSDAPHRLRLTDSPVPTRPPASPPPDVIVRTNSPRGLALRGEGPGGDATGRTLPPPRPTLTPEEMRMLLGEDSAGDEHTENGRNGHGPIAPGGGSR